MLGPITRAVENRGSSTVNVEGSRITATASSCELTNQPPIASSQATGEAARNRANTLGAESPAN